MAIKSKFLRGLERRRNIIERRGRTIMFKALQRQYKWLTDQVMQNDPNMLEGIITNLPSEPIKTAFLRYYRMFAPIANMYRKDMEAQKEGKSFGGAIQLKQSAEDEFFINDYEKFLTDFVAARAGEKIAIITETTKKRLLKEVRDALKVGVDDGLGIDEIQKLILKNARKSLGVNAKARSRAIAQTEIISGSNQAALYAADSTGLAYKKLWSTSGLPNIRDSHIFVEQWSIEQGGINPRERFDLGDGTFMLAPGDAAGGAANVINCRCALLIEVVL